MSRARRVLFYYLDQCLLILQLLGCLHLSDVLDRHQDRQQEQDEESAQEDRGRCGIDRQSEVHLKHLECFLEEDRAHRCERECDGHRQEAGYQVL